MESEYEKEAVPDAESEEWQFSGCKKPRADVLSQVVFLEVRLEGGRVNERYIQ